MQELKYVVRRLAQTPGFTVVTVLTLALGIGTNAAIFSAVNGILIKPLSFPGADELIGVSHWTRRPDGSVGIVPLTASMYFTYREQATTFQDFGVWANRTATVTGVADPEQVRTLNVTAGVLRALAVAPTFGRWFTEDDDTPGTPETVILTYGYWQRRFGGEPSVIGRSITIDSRQREIVGIMPQTFRFITFDPDVILPLRFNRNQTVLVDFFDFRGIARLKRGATLEQANADLIRVLPIWLRSWPAPPAQIRSLENSGFTPNLRPLQQEVVGDISSVLAVLMATVAVVLLIACANVANLVVVRVDGRQEEFAVRLALGSSSGRIMRDLITESAVLGGLGGLFGIGLAYLGVRLLATLAPTNIPRLAEIRIDPAVLGFSVALSLVATLLSGCLPALRYVRARLGIAGSIGARGASATRERLRVQNVLVVVQVALAVVLLVGSGLMIRTFQSLRSVQPGFNNPEEIQLVAVSMPPAQVPGNEQVFRMQKDISDRIAAIPGVDSVAFLTSPPLSPYRFSFPFYDAASPVGEAAAGEVHRFNWITPGTAVTLGTPLIAGREFSWSEVHDYRPVAMVSANLATMKWGSPEGAVGQRIRGTRTGPAHEIVGVLRDIHYNGVQTQAPTMVYWPVLIKDFLNSPTYVSRGVTFAIRSERAGTDSLLAEVRRTVWAVNSNLPLFDVRTLGDAFRTSIARTSFTLFMLTLAGGIALLLSMIGIYSFISYAVSQRTHEIGIRLALGAKRAKIKKMFVGRALVLTSIGVVIGLAAAASLTRLMESLLFGISPLDPVAHIAVSVFLVIAAAAAGYLPAHRAAALDPNVTLRTQ